MGVAVRGAEVFALEELQGNGGRVSGAEAGVAEMVAFLRGGERRQVGEGRGHESEAADVAMVGKRRRRARSHEQHAVGCALVQQAKRRFGLFSVKPSRFR